MTRRDRQITRREFVGGAMAAVGLAAGAPAILRGRNLNDKLNLAIIGAGGRGAANLKGLGSENVVALCDVNRLAIDAAAAQHPQAKTFRDLRRVFDHAADFDAVVVSTCEHTHAFSTMLALEAGKHVYCEKPLAYNIDETRKIREKAATVKVATQMGIQIHAGENYHQVVELVQSGAIGAVREAHVWVGRTWGLQTKEGAERNKDVAYVTARPDAEPVPPELDWDLWLGPAPARPFNSVYVPGPKWYRWWDFGNGTMSDLGSHWNDLPFWALDLHAPLTVEAGGGPLHPEIAPATMWAKYQVRRPWGQAAGHADVPPGRAQTADLAGRRDPAVAQRVCLHRRERNGPRRLQQARAAAGEAVRRFRRAAADAPPLTGPLRGMDRRLQDGIADVRQLRIRRVADRGESPRQRRVPYGEETDVESRRDDGHERARSGQVPQARVPQGVDGDPLKSRQRPCKIRSSRRLCSATEMSIGASIVIQPL